MENFLDHIKHMHMNLDCATIARNAHQGANIIRLLF